MHVGKGGAFLLAYYCGSISADYFFEGSVVYSRTPSLTSDQLVELVAAFKDHGIDYSKYCKRKTVTLNNSVDPREGTQIIVFLLIRIKFVERRDQPNS